MTTPTDTYRRTAGPAGTPVRPGQSATVSVLRVLNASGDRAITWDRERLTAGDPETVAAVREAERIFDEARSRGATAFRMAPRGGPAERIERFDPEAKDILIVPPMVGG